MNKKLGFLAVLLVAVVLTAASVSGTYAKYTSEFTSKTSTARVAKWAFQLKNNDGAYEDLAADFTFNLYETVNDANVKTGDNENIIAPGTTGKLTLKLKNDSEVNATYAVTYTVDNAGVPIEFSIDGSTWTKDLAAVAATSINMGAEAELPITWRWAFEGTNSSNYKTDQTDKTDTTLGTAATAATPKVKATVTVTQVD